jgi:Tfp pilus assembly PilM family ATPase
MSTMQQSRQRPSESKAAESSASTGSVSGITPRPVVQCVCPDCGATNTSDRKFCAGCGASIWEPCLSCGQPGLAGEKFCGSCGANTVEALQQRIDRIETQDMYARSLQLSGRHREAIAALDKLLAEPHPRLTKLLEPLEELRDELHAELTVLDEQRQRAVEGARACVATFDFDGAVEQLRAVPSGALDEEARLLLAAAEARQREIASLTNTIREGMAAKRYEGLLAKVERLLVIKPDHGPARGLGEKLRGLQANAAERQRDAMLEAATKKLNAHKYDEALKLLDEVPPDVRNEPFEKMLEFAREASWLDRDLREATVVDQHLLPLARRLLKIRPESPHAARLAAELEKGGAPAADGPLASMKARRAVQERTSVFGKPCSLLRGFRRIALAEGLASLPALAAHDTALGTAAGLALQAIGQAAIDVNLRPQDSSLVRKLLAGAGRKKPARSAWGLDVGRNALKAVRLTLAEDGRVTCDALDAVEYERPLSQPDADADSLIREALKTLTGRQPLKDAPVCLGMQGQELFTRFFKTPPVDRKRLDDLVQYEARNQIPFDLDLFCWGYHILGSPSLRTEDFAEFPIAVLAIKKSTIAQRLAACSDAGLKVDWVQADSVALHNFLVYDRLSPNEASGPRPANGQAAIDQGTSEPADELVATFDIGGDTSNFLVSGREFLWLRNFTFGGNDITKAMLRELKLTFAQAEALKRNPPAAPRLWRMYQAVEQSLEQFTTQALHSIRCYDNLYANRPITRVMLHGNACRLHGLQRALRAKN